MASPVDGAGLAVLSLDETFHPFITENRKPLIAVRGLAKSYSGSVALDRVDLDVLPGEFLTLLGPSGSGKTTLLGLIAGIILPSEGSIEFAGRDISRVPPERRDIGVVFQNYALFPHMTVRENVGFPLRFRNIAKSEQATRIREALELVRLDQLGDRYPSELSGGQQQRVALARAIIFNPTILLMDEPLSALDKKLRDHMKLELRQLQERLNLTIVYVTHDQDEALALSTRIAVMQDGRIQQIGSPEEIYEHPNSRFVADFVGDANLINVPVIGSQQDAIFVQLADKRLPIALDRTIERRNAGRALVLVRPEHIMVGPNARTLNSSFKGRVVSSLYEGNARRFDIDLNGTIISARTGSLLSGILPTPDEIVDFGWHDDHAHLVEFNDN